MKLPPLVRIGDPISWFFFENQRHQTAPRKSFGCCQTCGAPAGNDTVVVSGRRNHNLILCRSFMPNRTGLTRTGPFLLQAPLKNDAFPKVTLVAF